MYTYIHTYTHTYTHTYICTHTHTLQKANTLKRREPLQGFSCTGVCQVAS